MPSLSIIIPTHRRRDILRQTLECLGKQTLLRSSGAMEGKPSEASLEVIVVSDGPDEQTAEMIQSLSWSFLLQYFAIPKSQQGIARNRAVEKARGKYCLLIGDDIFLMPDACEKHLHAHEKHQSPITNHQTNSNFQTLPRPRARDRGATPKLPIAVLGFTTWDPTLKITPAMRWMERSGVQFGYPKIQKCAGSFIPASRQQWFTYTSNLSLPTWVLRHYPFREDVSLYGWEDIEWGKRIAEAGVQLFYDPDARAYHHHVFSDEELWERSRRLGVSAVQMEKLVPELCLCPRRWKKAAYTLYSLLPTYKGKHYCAFLRGMRQATS